MEQEHSPKCVGFIMDGNRRWANAQGLPLLEGHRAGYESLKRMIRVVGKNEIPHMVCYAFSTENWKRSKDEVSYLMTLIHTALGEIADGISEDGKNVRVRIIGERSRFPKKLQEEIVRIERKNINNPHLTVWVALSYGGRAEIVDAVNRAISAGDVVTEKSFERLLWTGDMPDPELIIRTSGEQRISNFLLWKASYSEFFFTNTLWPDFGETEFQSILDAYGKRQRRGGT